MITLPELPGIEINLFLLVFIGFGAGILSGFAGVGGGFVVTPALIILGFPANLAVGTTLAWMVGNSVIAVLGHRRLGNVDMKLSLVIIAAAMSGVEIGVRILNWAKDIGLANEIVLSISVVMLLFVGSYTFLESLARKRQLDRMLDNNEELPPAMRTTPLSQKLQSINIPPMLRFAKSQVTISLWILLVIGFFVGMLSGLIGVGGGFLMMPSLVYLVGLPSFTAVGTDLSQVVFSAAYGSIRHTLSGNVIIFVTFMMILSSGPGVRFGVLVTRFVRGVSVRLVLSSSIFLFALGVILKLMYLVLGKVILWLEIGSLVITFCSLGVAVFVIVALFVMGLRSRSGRPIPGWAESLVAGTNRT